MSFFKIIQLEACSYKTRDAAIRLKVAGSISRAGEGVSPRAVLRSNDTKFTLSGQPSHGIGCAVLPEGGPIVQA